jgi:hypothetical protein
MCLDTTGIGTKRAPRSENVSRYYRYRDKKSAEERECVSILRESRQKECRGARMCPDTTGIGTKRVPRSENVSRYCGNRDKKRSEERECVPILRESRQKKIRGARKCPDTAGIETKKGQKIGNLSRYEREFVPILRESRQKNSRVKRISPDTPRIGTKNRTQERNLSQYY